VHGENETFSLIGAEKGSVLPWQKAGTRRGGVKKKKVRLRQTCEHWSFIWARASRHLPYEKAEKKQVRQGCGDVREDV